MPNSLEFSQLPENVRKVIFFTKIKKDLQDIAEATSNLIEFNHDISTELGDITNQLDMCRRYFMFLVLFTKIVASDEFKRLVNDIETFNEENCEHDWNLELVEGDNDRPMTVNVCSFCDSVKDE